MSEPLLSVQGLRKEFRQRGEVVTAIDDVSFEVQQGETFGLVGESGSGKSTTAYCIVSLLAPTAGEIRYRGRDLARLSRREFRALRREIQFVFQDPYSSLDPRMTVGQIVAEPLDAHRVGTRRSRAEAARELLGRVGLDPAMTVRRPHEFSGGQRQRIGIARALALEPRLLLCDEPVSALDISVQAQILNLLKDLQSEFGLSYLFISHDLTVVRAMSDRIAVMRSGRIVETGPTEAVYANPRDPYTRELIGSVLEPDPHRREAARRPDAATS